jgi:hypothetical protein
MAPERVNSSSTAAKIDNSGSAHSSDRAMALSTTIELVLE